MHSVLSLYKIQTSRQYTCFRFFHILTVFFFILLIHINYIFTFFSIIGIVSKDIRVWIACFWLVNNIFQLFLFKNVHPSSSTFSLLLFITFIHVFSCPALLLQPLLICYIVCYMCRLLRTDRVSVRRHYYLFSVYMFLLFFI